MTTPLPTLPDMAPGIVGHDLTGWTVQCSDCLATATDERLFRLVGMQGWRFHWGGWDDGTNPRLCRPCRLARGCECQSCTDERRR